MLATSKGYLDIIHILIQNGHANPNLQNDVSVCILFRYSNFIHK